MDIPEMNVRNLYIMKTIGIDEWLKEEEIFSTGDERFSNRTLAR